MYSLELITQILRDMQCHKLRAILAMFGIIWGTVTLILLLALGEGFYTTSKKNMMGFAEGSVSITPGVTSLSFQGYPKGQKIQITAANVLALKQAIPSIHYIAPVLRSDQTITFNNQQIEATITATSPDYAILAKHKAAPGGRYIDALDVQQQREVIFLGKQVNDKFFKNQSAIGKQILINKIPFTVIGVMKAASDTGDWYNNIVVIPYTTAIKLWGNTGVSSFNVMPANTDDLAAFQQLLKNYLGYQYHFDPDDKSALWMFSSTDILKFFNWFFRAIELFLGFCGALTLAVGGIGVANMMYLIVTERTAEIGLRMALGARDTHILFQFLLEANIIVTVGCVIGFMIAGAVLLILHFVTLPKWLGTPQFSLTVLMITFFTLAITALCAGYFPARRAAKMTPVNALMF